MAKATHSDKIKAGQKRAAALGRAPGVKKKVSDAAVKAAIPLGTAAGARKVKLSVAQFIRRRRKIEDIKNDG